MTTSRTDEELLTLFGAAVKRALTEERVVVAHDLEQALEKAIARTLEKIGIHDTNDERKFQEDMIYLRGWRLSVQKAASMGVMAMITLFFSGIAGVLILGIKDALHK